MLKSDFDGGLSQAPPSWVSAGAVVIADRSDSSQNKGGLINKSDKSDRREALSRNVEAISCVAWRRASQIGSAPSAALEFKELNVTRSCNY